MGKQSTPQTIKDAQNAYGQAVKENTGLAGYNNIKHSGALGYAGGDTYNAALEGRKLGEKQSESSIDGGLSSGKRLTNNAYSQGAKMGEKMTGQSLNSGMAQGNALNSNALNQGLGNAQNINGMVNSAGVQAVLSHRRALQQIVH